ncbi:MAG: hypothetical protein CYG60_00155 [Actinobacteria bacterium]|nr:MAG: hypothetical protein CYG60_00155 [Actinomycetota bacterium]
MNYSRRQFLSLAAAGLPVVAAPLLFFRGTAHAAPRLLESQGPGKGITVSDARRPYDQATADMIHNRSVELNILEAGESPKEVKARVNLRIRGLRAEMTGWIR